MLHTKQREKETEKAREKTAKKQREWFKRDETRAKQIENVCVYIRADIDYSAVCVQDWEGEG